MERIDALDFKFNSYLTVGRDQALQAAREAEEAIRRGSCLGPMHGIPVAVKDQFWTRGIRSTGGSRILADFVPDDDSTVVGNLKKVEHPLAQFVRSYPPQVPGESGGVFNLHPVPVVSPLPRPGLRAHRP